MQDTHCTAFIHATAVADLKTADGQLAELVSEQHTSSDQLIANRHLS